MLVRRVRLLGERLVLFRQRLPVAGFLRKFALQRGALGAVGRELAGQLGPGGLERAADLLGQLQFLAQPLVVAFERRRLLLHLVIFGSQHVIGGAALVERGGEPDRLGLFLLQRPQRLVDRRDDLAERFHRVVELDHLVLGIDEQIAQRLVLFTHAHADVREALDVIAAAVAVLRFCAHVFGVGRAARATKQVRQLVHDPSHARHATDATILQGNAIAPDGTRLTTLPATKMRLAITGCGFLFAADGTRIWPPALTVTAETGASTGGRSGSLARQCRDGNRNLLAAPSLIPYRAAGTACSQQKRMEAMGLFSKDIETMDDLFVHTLEDIYYAENQILKALPEMIEKATDAKLKQGFKQHLGETETQVKRLEQVFKMHGEEPRGTDCPAIDGIIEEADDIAGDIADKEVLDAALIAAAQAVEHYEITRYGTLVAWAHQLGRDDCAAVLQKNLDEEKATDKKLTTLAESRVNRKAAS